MNMIEACNSESEFNDLCTQLELSVNLKKNLISIIYIFLSIELNLINIITHLLVDKYQKTI